MEGTAFVGREPTPLEEDLLIERIRLVRAEAQTAEIELASKRDAESDRQVKLGKIRHLRVNDVINSLTGEKWLDALQHWERRDPGKPITIDINSPGGFVSEGLALYDQILRMRRLGHHVTTRAVGVAASMGAVLLQAGDVRIADPRAKILIHEGSAGIGGTISQMEDYKALVDMFLADVLDILAERSKLSRRQIQAKAKRKDWWMTADEALKYGFIDHIDS